MLVLPHTGRGTFERVITLGKMNPLRFSQYQQWHEVFIEGPTRSVVGTIGNDFPGLYYNDPRTQEEHVVMVKGPVNWSKSRLVRRIGTVRRENYLEIALISSGHLPKEVSLEHWHQVRPIGPGLDSQSRDAMPDQWEALETLMGRSFELLPLPKVGRLHDWQRTAGLCLQTLEQVKVMQLQGDASMYVFFRTFRSNVSSYGREIVPDTQFQGTAELICQSGLASALLAYATVKPKHWQDYQSLGLELAGTLGHFYDPKTAFFQNTFPPRGEEWERRVIDTWYVFHNLYHILRIVSLTGQ